MYLLSGHFFVTGCIFFSTSVSITLCLNTGAYSRLLVVYSTSWDFSDARGRNEGAEWRQPCSVFIQSVILDMLCFLFLTSSATPTLWLLFASASECHTAYLFLTAVSQCIPSRRSAVNPPHLLICSLAWQRSSPAKAVSHKNQPLSQHITAAAVSNNAGHRANHSQWPQCALSCAHTRHSRVALELLHPGSVTVSLSTLSSSFLPLWLYH